jgi:hypothetical protein
VCLMHTTHTWYGVTVILAPQISRAQWMAVWVCRERGAVARSTDVPCANAMKMMSWSCVLQTSYKERGGCEEAEANNTAERETEEKRGIPLIHRCGGALQVMQQFLPNVKGGDEKESGE